MGEVFASPLSLTDSEPRGALCTLKVKDFTGNHGNQNRQLSVFSSVSEIANSPYAASFSTPHPLPKSRAFALSTTKNLQSERRRLDGRGRNPKSLERIALFFISMLY